MKYLENEILSYKLIICLCLLFVSTSCEEDINIDQKLITDKQLEIDANQGGFTLPGMQLNIVDVITIWRYEMQNNLAVDNYAGYVSLPSPFFNNVNTGTYAMVDSWNNQIWLVPSTGVLNQWIQMKKNGYDIKYPDLYAISIIFKTFAGHRLVDVFGPLPYTLYGTESDVPFDSEEEAYNVFFTELTNAVDVLKKFEMDFPSGGQIRYGKFDKSRYGGDYKTWIKVANTLRLG